MVKMGRELQNPASIWDSQGPQFLHRLTAKKRHSMPGMHHHDRDSKRKTLVETQTLQQSKEQVWLSQSQQKNGFWISVDTKIHSCSTFVYIGGVFAQNLHTSYSLNHLSRADNS